MDNSDTFLPAFLRRVVTAPDALAIQQGSECLSYAALDARSSELASVLLQAGVCRSDSVALCCERSIDTVATMLAAFKVGAAFVPIDTGFPADRIEYVVADASVVCVVVDSQTKPQIAALADAGRLPTIVLPTGPVAAKGVAKIFGVNTRVGTVSGSHATDTDSTVISGSCNGSQAGARAYIMYTSGSTGKPKGVPISHGALGCYCQADVRAYEVQADDRTLQFATLSFDISIEEIFPPLTTGSAVILRPRERSEAQNELSDLISTYQISAIHLATGYWHEWVDLMEGIGARVPDCLRLMVVTGEKVSPVHYQRWLTLSDQKVLWANAYGPTEATVSATVFIPPKGWQGKSLPIGKALRGYAAYILDNALKPVEKGQTGELYLGGCALAEGYLNRPEQTAKAFIPDPFSGVDGARLYRTGDLARWLEGGNIEYAGRLDHQLKIGSYRIEPGEIENAINTHECVSESLVCVSEAGDRQQLMAYVARLKGPLPVAEIAQHLSQLLPVYMLPVRYMMMDAFPKTQNGKIDRKALPDPSQAEIARRDDTVAPSNETEKALCDIWAEVLGTRDISVDDSFISLGGDSLMAVRVIARIHSALGFSVSTRDFFFLDTVALLAGHMQGKAVPRRSPAPIPAFINSRGRQLYTVLQMPKAEKHNGRGILLVPPLGNEQRRVQRPFKNLMQNLSRQGYTLLRFDWTATGNSSGNPEELTSVEPWSLDVQDAAKELSKHCALIDVVAIRTGALLTAQLPLTDLSIKRRYYWDPVLDGRQWVNEMQSLQSGILGDLFRFLRRRKSLTTSMVEYAGLCLSHSLVADLTRQQLPLGLESAPWNQGARLLLPEPDSQVIQFTQFDQQGLMVRQFDEKNNWSDPRATTKDMLINKVAAWIADDLVFDDDVSSLIAHRKVM